MYIFDKIFVTGCFGSCHFPTDDTVIDENSSMWHPTLLMLEKNTYCRKMMILYNKFMYISPLQ